MRWFLHKLAAFDPRGDTAQSASALDRAGVSSTGCLGGHRAGAALCHPGRDLYPRSTRVSLTVQHTDLSVESVRRLA